MIKNYLRSILLSDRSNLLMTSECYTEAFIDCFPMTNQDVIKPLSWWNDIPTYKQETTKALEKIRTLSQDKDICITDDYHSEEIPSGSIAYYRIFGTILADDTYFWYFSTKQFERDILASEANPSIACHFLHINSGGGEAWYLDRISETLRNCAKPIYTLCEHFCCSAAYYIGVHGNAFKALTQNDTLGSVGTMISFWDLQKYYEQLGFKWIEVYADQSDLKNKKSRDLKDGKPKQYKEEILNPLTDQFIKEIKMSRASLNTLPAEHPVFRGESFTALPSIDNGLIDGLTTFADAIAEASTMAQGYISTLNLRHRLSSLL